MGVPVEGQVGIQNGQIGSQNILRIDKVGALVTQDTHGKYYEAVKQGNTYYLSSQSAAATAYAGAAAGTPLLAVYNPLNSGKDLSILQASIGLGSSGTTAALVLFEWWLGPVIAIGTGTVTVPINMYSQVAGGSVTKGFVNTALTSQTGTLNLIRGILGGGANPGTTAPSTTATAIDPVDGVIVVAPGNMVAIGSRTTLAAGSIDYSILWEEIPV